MIARYFDDIRLIGGSVVPVCTTRLDCRFMGTWSVEFMLSGRMTFAIDGGEPVVMESPIVFWHSPRHCYQYGAMDGKGWYHHWVLMKGRRARRLVEEGFMPLSPAGYVHVRDAQAVAALFRAVIQRIGKTDPLETGLAVTLLERLLCLLMAEIRAIAPSMPYADALDTLASRIRATPLTPVVFPLEAKRMGLSYSRFRRLFRDRLGRAPHDYLLFHRMQNAATALHALSRSVKQVALEAGYDDAAQFSKLFKKKIGLAPRLYRVALPLSST
ncbi:MAG: AraC family transcriptional regulator [Verrucomicrobia bacterium]|nr:AraC family transcriptional regulator [Verrucomicrobiota bacterium]